MASDSLISSTGATTTLSGAAISVLDKFLSDNNAASQIVADAGNGSKIVVSSGANGDINIAITPPTEASTGSLSDGAGKTLNYQLSANLGLASKSVDATDTGSAKTYVQNIIDKYIPPTTQVDTPAGVQKQSLVDSLNQILSALATTEGGSALANVQIRTIDFFSSSSSSASLHDSDSHSFAILDSDGSYQGIDSLVGANDVLLDAGTSTGTQLFVLNLAGLAGKTLALQNVEAAVLAAGGTVRVEGNTPIKITSDNQAQNITGGGGNDTLIGTGNDTLTGGAGNDVFGFSGKGKFIVTDFNKAGDMLAFDSSFASDINALKAKVTSVTTTSNSVTYNFGPDTSITLVGVSATDLTASMIKFTLT